MNRHGSRRAPGRFRASSPDRNAEESALEQQPRGGILGRAIRNQQLWLTFGYFAVLLLLARAYA